jgi:hypothetical protein
LRRLKKPEAGEGMKGSFEDLFDPKLVIGVLVVVFAGVIASKISPEPAKTTDIFLFGFFVGSTIVTIIVITKFLSESHGGSV